MGEARGREVSGGWRMAGGGGRGAPDILCNSVIHCTYHPATASVNNLLSLNGEAGGVGKALSDGWLHGTFLLATLLFSLLLPL